MRASRGADMPHRFRRGNWQPRACAASVASRHAVTSTDAAANKEIRTGALGKVMVILNPSRA